MDKQFGDLDGDGKVDKKDLELLKNLVKNKALFEQLPEEDKKRLDMNNDGTLDYEDVIEMIKVIKSHVDAEGEIPPEQEQNCINSLRQRLRSTS